MEPAILKLPVAEPPPAPPSPEVQPAPETRPAPEVVTAWPRSAQLATAFLLGMVVALLSVHILSSVRWSTRPSELEQSPGAYRINLNQASRAELLQVPGIGPSLAEKIEDYRRERGAFHSVDELVQVRGIGPATLARIRPWLYVSQESSEESLTSRPARRTTSGPSTAASSAMEGEERRPAGKKETQIATPIDINRATAEQLQRLPGIGPKLSERIIEERAKRPFKSVDELRRVYGIGPKTLERLRPHVTVNGESVATAPE